MSVPGFPEAIIALLDHSAGNGSASSQPTDSASSAAAEAANPPAADARSAADLLTEVSWVLAYLTAGAEAHLNRMVALGVVPPLVAHLVWCTQQVSAVAMAQEEPNVPLQSISDDDNYQVLRVVQT